MLNLIGEGKIDDLLGFTQQTTTYNTHREKVQILCGSGFVQRFARAFRLDFSLVASSTTTSGFLRRSSTASHGLRS